jgi:phosphopantetheinyl transferase (holo-ACP synthase)
LPYIGNDVVDWQDPANAKKSWDLPYLKKILTPAEIGFVHTDENSDLALWSLWGCKETAYKVIRKSNAGAAFLPRQWSVIRADLSIRKGQKRRGGGPSLPLNQSQCTQTAGKVILPGKDAVFVQCFATADYVHCIGSDDIDALDKIIWRVELVPTAEHGKNADPSLFVRQQLAQRLADNYHLNLRDLEIRRAKKDGELQPPCVYLTHAKAPFDISLSHDGQFVAYAFLHQSN